MSNYATAWAIRAALPSGPKFVLVILADHANADWMCWPSQETLAEETGLSLRSVARHLNYLTDLGLISRQHRHQDAGQRNSDVISLHIDAPAYKPYPGAAPLPRVVGRKKQQHPT